MIEEFIVCENCNNKYRLEEFENNLGVCKFCGKHFRICAYKRLNQIADLGTFNEINADLVGENILNFPGYDERLDEVQKSTSLREAVITGTCKIGGIDVAIGIMDSYFFMGSMGGAVGEKLTRLVEEATDKELPLCIFVSSGGARMQEGIISLMQMAKISGALKKHDEKKLLYISVITDPTTGGASASFALKGDIVLAEPGALVCFSGPSLIKQMNKREVDISLLKSEKVLEYGQIDKIVERKDMKKLLIDILNIHKK